MAPVPLVVQLNVWGTTFVPVFSDEQRARGFHRAARATLKDTEPVEIRPSLLGTRRFMLGFRGGDDLAADLASIGAPATGYVKIVLNPSFDPTRAAISYQHELGNLTVEDLLGATGAGFRVDIPAASLPVCKTIWAIRQLFRAADTERPLLHSVRATVRKP